MHAYHNAKVATPEYFRSEFSKFMPGMKGGGLQEIHNRGEKYEVGKYPLIFPIYRWMWKIMYYSPNNYHLGGGDTLPSNDTWCLGITIVFDPMWTITTGEIIFWWSIFHTEIQTKRWRIITNLGIWTPTPTTQIFPHWMNCYCIVFNPSEAYGEYDFFTGLSKYNRKMKVISEIIKEYECGKVKT